MRQKILLDRMEGAYLQQHYFEAFLMQSAYVEAILKHVVDFHFFTDTYDKVNQVPKVDNGILKVIRQKINHYGLNECIRCLEESKIISKEHAKLLHDYRKKRNKILHDLLKEIGRDEFEVELQAAYDICKSIIKSDWFDRMASICKPTKIAL